MIRPTFSKINSSNFGNSSGSTKFSSSCLHFRQVILSPWFWYLQRGHSQSSRSVRTLGAGLTPFRARCRCLASTLSKSSSKGLMPLSAFLSSASFLKIASSPSFASAPSNSCLHCCRSHFTACRTKALVGPQNSSLVCKSVSCKLVASSLPWAVSPGCTAATSSARGGALQHGAMRSQVLQHAYPHRPLPPPSGETSQQEPQTAVWPRTQTSSL
mmetsp:Transcript_21963/g.39883  ORF Transcript_21963/g.39883 Transcript_21963/m.39883 type:complete len:214 (-) Transcript_21963:58-699(-)